jgi:hypothetical protein
MRKKTASRARKQNKASSNVPSGLIVKAESRIRSAGTESPLDDRSHRALWASPAPAEGG